MNTEAKELITLFNLLTHITDHYAAVADAEPYPDWKSGVLIISVDEGGRTQYAKALNLNEAPEAKARLIRHDLEQMIEDCKLPIWHTGAAA